VVPQRIVLVAHSHKMGGIERHVVSLAEALAQRGHAIAFAGPADGWLGERMAASGHVCVDVAMKGMFDPWSAWKLARFSRQWQATVLHGHAMRGGRYADWVGRWAGIPTLVTAHSTNAWKWLHPRMHLVAVSDAVRRHLVAQGLPADRIQVIYLGVPDADGEHAEPAARPDGAPLRVGVIGRLDPVKGQDIALGALARLGMAGPVRLLFAGAGSSEWTEWLHAQARVLGVTEWVDFLGQVDNIPQLLAGLDLVIAPSRREALSLALVEAAAAGRPCIATRIGGIPEVVLDGVSGVLVPPDDPVSLSEALSQLAGDADRRSALGRAARQCYEQRFTIDVMCERLEALYQKVVTGHREGVS